MWVYSALLLAVLVLGAPWWLLRMATSGRYRAGLAGRLGWIPKSLRDAAEGRDVVWIHAVSVGEVMAAARLVRDLQEAWPESLIVVSTTTATGQRLARQRLPEVSVFYLPLDFAFAVRRYLRALQPKMLVLMESELWPNLIVQCAKAGIPVAVVNARVSDRSFPRYMRLQRLWRPLLGKISLFLAQSGETATRLEQIGAPAERIKATGNLKYDLREGRASTLVAMLREQLPADACVVVCGSTLEGEEKLLLEVWPEVLAAEPKTVMALAPRHPERFAGVAAMAEAGGFRVVRASEFRLRPVPLAAGDIFLLDTIGDLAAVYSLGAAAFVGGSLIAAGGHNPLEPARFGVPVLMGPSYENFREIVDALQAHDAIRICTAETLGDTLLALLGHAEEAQAMGTRGREVFEAQAGATARTVEALTALLQEKVVSAR
ncbi:MAG TPA: 3-deoxy-D-manno-octulosonic acid transferase [Edaphobacter sp.]|nr:3-deoxy-D-manno-octulosonic acid transferase [Edaphobacter sp.]